MNEQAQQLITDAGAKVLKYLEATEGFTVEQAPLLAQEILTWGLTKGITLSIIGLLGIVFVWVFGLKIKAACKEKTTSWDKEDETFCFGLTVLVSVLPCIPMIAGISVVLKVLIAPRLFLIEAISRVF